MTNASLIRLARFAFGNISPCEVLSIPMGSYFYMIPYTFKFDTHYEGGIERIEIRHWKMWHKKYCHEFFWGYGPKSNALLICEGNHEELSLRKN